MSDVPSSPSSPSAKRRWRILHNTTMDWCNVLQKTPIDHIRNGINQTSRITASTAGLLTSHAFLNHTSSSKKRRNWWGIEWLVGSNLGQFLFLSITAFSLVVASSVAWDSFGEDNESDDEVNDDVMEERRYRAALWYSWALFFDPGTQTGLSSYSPTKVLFCAGLISSIGFIFNLVMLGFIVDQIREMLLEAKAIYGREVVNDHILILGWTDKTIFLLEALMVELMDEGAGWFAKRPTIVVLGETPRVNMIQSTRLGIPKKLSRKSNVRLIFRQGFTHEIEDLVKVSATSAKVVIVLGSSRDPEMADLTVLSSALAVKSMSQTTLVLSELRLFKSVSIVKSLGGDSVVGVAPMPLMDNLMVMSTLTPAVGQVVTDLLRFKDSSGFLIKPQPSIIQRKLAVAAKHSKVSPHSLGDGLLTFGQTRKLLQNSVVMGIVPLHGDIVLAPPDSHVLFLTDQLLVITNSRANQEESQKFEILDNNEEEESKSTSFDDSGTESKSQVSWRASIRKRSTKQIVVVLGWRTGIGMTMLMKGFDDRLESGAEVHILSSLSAEYRQDNLASSDFVAHNIVIIHHVGEITRQLSLKSLPLSTACNVLILRDDPFWKNNTSERGDDTHVSDARALTAAVMICQLLDEESIQPNCRPPIAVQFLNSLAQRILKKQSHLRKQLNTLVPIHRNALETGVLAMAAAKPKLIGFFERILLRSASECHAPNLITSISPHKLLKKQARIEHKADDNFKASFWDLDALVREQGALLLGWHRNGHTKHDINPQNKHQVLAWSEADLLLIVHEPSKAKLLFRIPSDSFHEYCPSPTPSSLPLKKTSSRKFLSFSEKI